MSSRSRVTTSRRVLAGFGAFALAALGLTAVSTTAQASDVKQVHVTASVDGGTATAGVASTINFTIANAARIDDFHKFTIVLPPGVSAPPGKNSPTALGVTGAGNWALSVTTCGTVPNCSWLVVGKALLPKAISRVRPGTNLVVAVGLVPNAPGTLTFNVIHVEDDAFTVLDSPTITVVGGVAGAFCVKDTLPGNVMAGGSKTFTVQAIAAGSWTGTDPCVGRPVAYTQSRLVRVHLTTDDGSTGPTRITAVAPVSGTGDGTATVATPTVPPTFPANTPSDITFSFSTSSSGKFTFTSTFQMATHNQSFDVAELSPGTVDGNSGGFDIDPGPATQITLTSVYDSTTPALGTALTVGAPFTATYYVSDSFGNVTTVGDGAVTGIVGGLGTFTQSGSSIGNTIGTEGTVSGTYNHAGTDVPVTLQLTSNSASSAPILVSFADVTAVFTPGTAGTIQTTNFATNPDGTPNCVLDASNPACVGVSLSQGAFGAVSLGLEDCATAGATVGVCAPGTSGNTSKVVAHLNATLSTIDNTTNPPTVVHLYSADKPASLTYVCSAINCPWDKVDDEHRAPYNAWEESVEAYNAFPIYAQDGSTPNGPYYLVPACQTNLDPTLPDPQPAATVVAGGQKSCVDVASLVRNIDPKSAAYNTLSFTILYWDDYKMVP